MSTEFDLFDGLANIGNGIWEEKRLLARLLLKKYDIEVIGKCLQASHFQEDKHGQIYLALQSLPSNGSNIPLIEVLKRFDEKDEGHILEAIEEALGSSCSAPQNWAEMVDIAFNIRLRYEKRVMCEICQCGQPFEPDPEEYWNEEFEDYDFDPEG